MDAPVKFFALKIRNTSDRTRRLSTTCCLEWVLAELRPQSLMHVVTEIDPKTGALLARNPYNSEFPGRVAFLDCTEQQRTIAGDRTEFFGRNGTAAKPVAIEVAASLGQEFQSVSIRAKRATQSELDDRKAKAGKREIVFILGAAANIDEARGLVQRFRGTGPARRALEGVWHSWQRTLGTVYVETPDQGINTLVNVH